MDTRQDCRNAGDAANYLHKTFVPDKAHCTIRDFAPHDIKTCLKHRKVIFIGDSLARNQQQSLQCMTLEGPEENIQVSNGYKGVYDSHFPEYNSSIHYVYSLILSNFSDTIKHLDINPRDIIVVGTGPWWQHIDQFKLDEPALASLETWAAFPGGIEVAKAFMDSTVKRFLLEIDSAIPPETRIIFRTPDLNHFFGGMYDASSAGSGCLPFDIGWDSEDDGRLPFESAISWVDESVRHHTQGTRIEIFDVTRVSGLRPDAHPSSQMHTSKDGISIIDCAHWCLPGVPDTWNRILLTDICDVDINGTTNHD